MSWTMNKENIVFTTSNVMEANFVKSLLEAHDIEVFLFDENLSRIQPLYTHAIGGVKLAVPSVHVSEAREVLAEYLAKEGKGGSSGRLSPFDFSTAGRGLGRWLVLIVTAVLWPFGLLFSKQRGPRSG
jgi:hypothetical protein